MIGLCDICENDISNNKKSECKWKLLLKTHARSLGVKTVVSDCQHFKQADNALPFSQDT